MRNSLLTLCLLLGALSGSARAATVPDWTLPTADGIEVTYSEEWAGGPTILLFWASWCPYCKALMPHLQSILEEYRGERAPRIYALSIKEDGDPAMIVANMGYEFTVFPEGDAVAETYGVTGTPGLFIVDERGDEVLNLRDVMDAMTKDAEVERLNNRLKAARRGPYWAARIRESLDTLYPTAP